MTNKRRRISLVVAGIVLVALLALGGVSIVYASKIRMEADQPIAFDHEVMVEEGIGCLFCHTEARRSPAAGMPSVEKCMGCHAEIATDNSEIQKVKAYWDRLEPIPWVREYRLPRFVYFSHQIHIAQGLNCERCHGDVGHMSIARPVVTINMGWCLDCHETQSNVDQLRDCVVCHQ